VFVLNGFIHGEGTRPNSRVQYVVPYQAGLVVVEERNMSNGHKFVEKGKSPISNVPIDST
jgi:hypothetical protein